MSQDQVPALPASPAAKTKSTVPAVTQREITPIIPTATADNVMDSKSAVGRRIRAGANDYGRTTIDFVKSHAGAKEGCIRLLEHQHLTGEALRRNQIRGINLTTTSSTNCQ